MADMNNLILYTTEDGKSQIKLRSDLDTVWLTQLEMAELFDATKQNVSLHLKNIFEDLELMQDSVVKDSLTTAADGKKYQTQLYNLDAILAVGYRVRSPRGVQFRRWASTVLKEFLTKGFVIDDERLKNPDGRPDYFDEMLARIRDIRASEKRFYQKVRDLFALSSDYDKTDQATQQFFATVQNMLLYAVTQKTAAELITARANANDPNFGLLHWKGAQVRKQDILVAKNYLTEDEIDTLNRLVVIFLETAELRTKSRQEIRMAFWQQNVEQIISSNGFSVLTNVGKVSHTRMEQQLEPMFLDFASEAMADDVRFKNHGLAPKSAADFAFLLHGFHFLKDEGVMAIILPHGVLFRGGAEERIRTKLLMDGHIDTVIGLPSNLFYSTGIPVCILVLKKCKKPDDVLFINAAEHFDKGKRQNQLSDAHIAKIIKTYQFREEEARYSRRVEMAEIEKNDFNLNISRYISTAVAEKEIDLAATQKQLVSIEADIKAAKDKHNAFLKELGLSPLP